MWIESWKTFMPIALAMASRRRSTLLETHPQNGVEATLIAETMLAER